MGLREGGIFFKDEYRSQTFLQSMQGKNNQQCDTGYGWFSDSTEHHWCVSTKNQIIKRERERELLKKEIRFIYCHFTELKVFESKHKRVK